jgi:hypothetical protein
MGKYKYTVGVEDDAQAGQVLCRKIKDRKAAAMPGEDKPAEPSQADKRRGRGEETRIVSVPKKFAPEKLTAAESL